MVVSLWNGVVTPDHSLIPERKSLNTHLLPIMAPSSNTHKSTEWFVDVEDTALLHVAAAVLPNVQDQRIFGFAVRFNWDDVLAILRSLDPKRKIPENFSGGLDPNEIEPRDKAEGLLKEMGRPGWKSLQDSIKENVGMA